MFKVDKHIRKMERASKDKSSLGNILLELGYCTEESLRDVVMEQMEANPLLGKLMVIKGVINRNQLEHAIIRQRVLRGEADPMELKRFGHIQRRDAIKKMADRLETTAQSADALAHKVVR